MTWKVLVLNLFVTLPLQYCELEVILGDIERARAIYELAINQARLDMPEVLWKSFIDFEIEQEEYDNVRSLYRRLLQRTQHVKVSQDFFYTDNTSFEGRKAVFHLELSEVFFFI